ncbi:hypothetical protein M407DRAFT_29338 [Tulasnella calospora MUT 4182]|uniref:F-box domain-containing protein n=1 Tax=Tulasnella calospora MUT 4182 TaxID=1051891 RepID=A0A0C3QA97_9AGAM|nr:hypothetical protein M407DRAFT_29338 [Tulasnella calospora MUT 4182]
MSQAQHGSRGGPDPIDLLPEEIFIKIIRLSIKADTPARDLAKLTAVCRLWKRILEEAPTFWTGATAAEVLEGLRRALRMVQDAPLDLKFDSSTAAVNIETFFQEMGSKISQWKTLFVNASGGSQVVGSTCPASTAPPTLEVLCFVYYYARSQVAHEIDLFGGQPAPASLKDVQLKSPLHSNASLSHSGIIQTQWTDSRAPPAPPKMEASASHPFARSASTMFPRHIFVCCSRFYAIQIWNCST